MNWAVAKDIELGGAKLSICRLVGVAFWHGFSERPFIVTYTYFFVRGSLFSPAVVKPLSYLWEAIYRSEGSKYGGSRAGLGQIFGEATPFSML